MASAQRRLLLASGLALLAGRTAAQVPLAAGNSGPSPNLPAPDLSHNTRRFSRQSSWPTGKTPRAPEGFTVTAYATDLDSPRWMYLLPNGDVLVAEARTGRGAGGAPNRITLLRDQNGDGVPEQRHVLLDGLNQPFGMAFLGEQLYVANTDGVLRFPFSPGMTQLDRAKGHGILGLPAGGYNNHWTRNLLVSRDNKHLYVSVGSASNVGEHGPQEEQQRANILQIDPDGSGLRVFAHGLRNPNGMAWEPVTGKLWTAVNERDNIGNDLVPDYITSVQENGFYGWPYSYWGNHLDPRLKGQRPDLVKEAIVPDYAMGAHTASIGLTFVKGESMPARFRGGAMVGQRGSWNREEFAGYRVAFVPFADGKPSGPPEDFLTGFLADARTGETYGRPVGVIQDATGAVLVADDAGNTIWRVAPKT